MVHASLTIWLMAQQQLKSCNKTFSSILTYLGISSAHAGIENLTIACTLASTGLLGLLHVQETLLWLGKTHSLLSLLCLIRRRKFYNCKTCCFQVLLYTTPSSIYVGIALSNPVITPLINLWKVVGAFFMPNGITKYQPIRLGNKH